jgi:O-antigen/teichoic acid export membrane protein
MIRIVLVFLHGWVAARLFGAEPYGIYVEGVATVILLSAIGQLGLSRAVTRFVAIHIARHEPGDVFRTLTAVLKIGMPVAVGIGLMLTLSAGSISGIFHTPTLAIWLRILGVAVPLLTLSTLLSAFTQGFQRMRHKTIALDIVAPAVEVMCLILFAKIGVGSTSLPLAYVSSLVTASVLLIFFSRVDLQTLEPDLPRAAAHSSRISLKPILSFAAPVWVAEMLMTATARLSVLMLGLFAASAAVGIFGVAQRLVGLGGVFLLSINLMFGPMVADVVEQRV